MGDVGGSAPVRRAGAVVTQREPASQNRLHSRHAAEHAGAQRPAQPGERGQLAQRESREHRGAMAGEFAGQPAGVHLRGREWHLDERGSAGPGSADAEHRPLTDRRGDDDGVGAVNRRLGVGHRVVTHRRRNQRAILIPDRGEPDVGLRGDDAEHVGEVWMRAPEQGDVDGHHLRGPRSGELDPAATAGLGPVGGPVGLGEQLLGVTAAERDPDARRDPVLDPGDLHRRLDGREDPLTDLDRHGRVDLIADRDELIAAVPGDRVTGADGAAQSPGYLDEHRVAHDVAVTVVDRLELVEVDEQDRGGARVPARVGDRMAQSIVQQRPVGEARERVMDGVMADLFPRRAAVRTRRSGVLTSARAWLSSPSVSTRSELRYSASPVPIGIRNPGPVSAPVAARTVSPAVRTSAPVIGSVSAIISTASEERGRGVDSGECPPAQGGDRAQPRLGGPAVR